METVAEHLKSRYMDLDLHQPFVDEEARVATFWLYTPDLRCVGYHQYRPEGDKSLPNDHENGKYYTFRTGYTPWGVESLSLSPDVVFLTEGVFDACRFTRLGYSALAVLSNDPQRDFKNWLTMLHRRVVAVCDNDTPGKRLAKFGHQSVFTNEKDLGDESDEFVLNLIKEYG